MDEHQIMSDYCSVEVTQRPSSLGAVVVTFNGQEPIYDIGMSVKYLNVTVTIYFLPTRA